MCNAAAAQMGIGMVTSSANAAIELNDIDEQQRMSSQISKFNKNMADFGSADTAQRGGQTEGTSRMKYSQLIGEQKSALSASGVNTQSGSAYDVMADASLMSEYEAQLIRNNAAREAWGYKVKKAELRQQDAINSYKFDRERAGAWMRYAGGMTGSASSGLGSFLGSGSGGK